MAIKVFTAGERLFAADLNDNFAELDGKGIDYAPLEYINTGFSGGDILVNVNNGARFSFKRVMAGNETLTAPQNMPEGSVANLLIDATNTNTDAPVVESRASARTTGNATSHPITLPSGVTAGDLILAFFSVDGNPTVSTTSTGWNKLGQRSNSNVVTGAVFWKIATGSNSLTLTTSASEESSHVTLRVSGVKFPAAIASASSDGSSTNSDPAQGTTSATDSRGRLWVVSRAGDSNVVATVAPSGYDNLQTQAANTTAGASTNTAEKTTSGTAASEDPGTFTSASEQWVCWTVGVDSTGSFTLSYGSEFDEKPTVTGKTLLQLVRLPESRYLALEAWSG
jgi:hypothetical protein